MLRMDEWIGGSYLEARNDYEENKNRLKRKKRCGKLVGDQLH